MSGEGPKLFANKPKKSKLKASTPITMAPASSATAAEAAVPPPPPPPPPFDPRPKKESFIRRYRFLWPMLLFVNFTIGAYVLIRMRTKGKDTSEEETPEGPTISTTTSTAPVSEKPVRQPITELVARAPVPEDRQRELFKWMLEEKRKVKPRDAEEKKRIDEEKAILKQFIRAKSVPSL
ncbi:Unknown protein [Striga hermonthica]|uniref:Uncharacterized protein n=1 Tax=Striga hermonthica TaxID=68872 RepID=A0A9N7MLX8_STRHE|nr:Unknown protein [Striga hermonthica]